VSGRHSVIKTRAQWRLIHCKHACILLRFVYRKEEHCAIVQASHYIALSVAG